MEEIIFQFLKPQDMYGYLTGRAYELEKTIYRTAIDIEEADAVLTSRYGEILQAAEARAMAIAEQEGSLRRLEMIRKKLSQMTGENGPDISSLQPDGGSEDQPSSITPG